MTDDIDPTDAPFADGLWAETLFTTADARRPDPEFAAALRRRIARAVGVPPTEPQEVTMTVTTPSHADAFGYRSPGSASLKTYLFVSDARAAIDWYGEVFGARVTYEPIVMDDGRIGHVELDIDGTTIQMADDFPEIGAHSPTELGGSTFMFTLYVPDCDATYARAIEAGAAGLREPVDEFYGARAGQIRDPFGHRWSLQTYLGDDGDPQPGGEPAEGY